MFNRLKINILTQIQLDVIIFYSTPSLEKYLMNIIIYVLLGTTVEIIFKKVETQRIIID